MQHVVSPSDALQVALRICLSRISDVEIWPLRTIHINHNTRRLGKSQTLSVHMNWGGLSWWTKLCLVQRTVLNSEFIILELSWMYMNTIKSNTVKFWGALTQLFYYKTLYQYTSIEFDEWPGINMHMDQRVSKLRCLSPFVEDNTVTHLIRIPCA